MKSHFLISSCEKHFTLHLLKKTTFYFQLFLTLQNADEAVSLSPAVYCNVLHWPHDGDTKPLMVPTQGCIVK